MDRDGSGSHHDCQQDGAWILSQGPKIELRAEQHEERRNEEALGDAGELQPEALGSAQPGQDKAGAEPCEERRPPVCVATSVSAMRIRSVNRSWSAQPRDWIDLGASGPSQPSRSSPRPGERPP